MRERMRTDKVLVLLMLREAGELAEYCSAGPTAILANEKEGRHLRDGIALHLTHFLESGTKLGKPFRNANPLIAWSRIDAFRQDMVHNYPEVSPGEVLAFAREVVPATARRLRRARFP